MIVYEPGGFSDGLASVFHAQLYKNLCATLVNGSVTVNVSCSWINKNSMAIQVTVTEPFTSVAHKFLYSWAWKTEAKPSPNPPGSYYIIPPTPDTADKVLLLESGSFVLYEDGDLEALEDISTLPGVHLENGDFWLLESGNYWIN